MGPIEVQVFAQPVIHVFTDSLLNSPIFGHDLYLDPGSGSYLLQLLIAALVGSAFMLRTYWSRIKGFLTGKREENEAEEKPDEE